MPEKAIKKYMQTKTIATYKVNNFLDLFSGTLNDFLENYEFEIPKVFTPWETTEEATDWEIEWRSDIRIDRDFNIYLPTYYITNYKDNSYSDSGTGHNNVSDKSYDTNEEYENEPTLTFEKYWPELLKEIKDQTFDPDNLK